MTFIPEDTATVGYYQINCPTLPLAIYREIAAHLRQVTGVEVDLLPQTSQKFDYHQSQIEGLRIQCQETATPQERQRVNQILAFYQNRYGELRIEN
ncbi:MAG: hypothetical protein F6K31_04845 [Symploca sp. SIO2G7]|nr:hypothetical protein [Symploca sp. SIO2G7]